MNLLVSEWPCQTVHKWWVWPADQSSNQPRNKKNVCSSFFGVHDLRIMSHMLIELHPKFRLVEATTSELVCFNFPVLKCGKASLIFCQMCITTRSNMWCSVMIPGTQRTWLSPEVPGRIPAVLQPPDLHVQNPWPAGYDPSASTGLVIVVVLTPTVLLWLGKTSVSLRRLFPRRSFWVQLLPTGKSHWRAWLERSEDITLSAGCSLLGFCSW